MFSSKLPKQRQQTWFDHHQKLSGHSHSWGLMFFPVLLSQWFQKWQPESKERSSYCSIVCLFLLLQLQRTSVTQDFCRRTFGRVRMAHRNHGFPDASRVSFAWTQNGGFQLKGLAAAGNRWDSEASDPGGQAIFLTKKAIFLLFVFCSGRCEKWADPDLLVVSKRMYHIHVPFLFMFTTFL